MTEIKIKVWDTVKKEMSLPMSLPMLAGYLTAIHPNLGNEVYLLCTGINDKNGKEICQGDIVNLSSWEPSRYLVAWDRGAFYMAKKNLQDMGDIKYIEGSEIIGNIYENPELLNLK